MAGTWKTVMMYKKYCILKNIKLNTEYDLKKITGLTFKNIKIFFTIKSFLSKSFTYSIDLIYEEVRDGVIVFKNKTNSDITCIIDAVVYENGGSIYE